MNPEKAQSHIENDFRKLVRGDKKVKNAYLLVHSDKLNVDLCVAEGKTGNLDAHPQQPNHLASVGKIFTATLFGIMHDRGELSFDDPIAKYLDADLKKGLHVFRGTDYSAEIKIHHLLRQTSGLDDVFYHLLKKMMKNPQLMISPREAVEWGKQNLKPRAKPGQKHLYGDTNYYLLGLIVEHLTRQPFHESLHRLVFDPLGMKRAYMHGFSKPAVSEYPTAKLYLNGVDALSLAGLAQIDYAGGGVVAPLEEFLIFMKALVNNRIVKKVTLERMLEDDIPMGFPFIGINYGYSIWKYKTVPLILPAKYNCWGCVGVSGAFMFYHPLTESYLIGAFNDEAYKSKAIKFMLLKVIKQLLKTEPANESQ